MDMIWEACNIADDEDWEDFWDMFALIKRIEKEEEFRTELLELYMERLKNDLA